LRRILPAALFGSVGAKKIDFGHLYVAIWPRKPLINSSALMRGTWLQRNRCDNPFYPSRIGYSEYRGLEHIGVAIEVAFDFRGEHFLAARYDHVLLSVDDIKVAFGVDIA
jgi:hypothetical protein